MLARILRSLIALATIIVVYQAYVLLAVPLIEPPLVRYHPTVVSAEDHDKAEQAVSTYQRLLSHYFPADHWSQQRPPKVLGHWPVLLVVDNYKREDNGWLKINQFAILIFPTPVAEGSPPPNDAIVMEAPQGAELQFDEDFRPDRFQIGEIIQGKFPGPILIHSEMHDPGPQDDLVIETSDLAMNSKLLYTLSPVRFRLGSNVGSGRELEIRFQKDEPAAAGKMGISSLEIRRDVQLRVDLKTDRFLPGGADGTQSVQDLRSHGDRGNEGASGKNEGTPPATVTCTGPFQFDFVRYVASFDQNVQVRQQVADGSGDRIDAQQLDIRFAAKAAAGGANVTQNGDAVKRQQAELSQLEPALVVAQGGPVSIVSPTRNAQAQAERVQLDLRGRRVILDGGRSTTLTFGLNVLKSPKIEYWHPASDAGTKVGRFRASGPGSLYYVINPAKPDEVFQAGWQKSVELGRSNGQPVLTLDGRPNLAVAGMGSVAADQLSVWFRELVGAPASAGGLALPSEGAGGERAQLVPDRLAATGQVDIASARLSARTEQLAVIFETVAGEATGENLGPSIGNASASAYSSKPTNAARQPQGLAAKLQSGGGNDEPTSAYRVDADKLELGVRLRGRDASPTNVSCDGNVVLREVFLVPNPQQPLEIRGNRLTAVGLEGDAAHIAVMGSGATGAAQYVSSAADAANIAKAQLAQVIGRGMTLYTSAIEIDQKENRLWSDGFGQATILITKDLGGKATPAPTPFEISWQNGMTFDGRIATFRGNIQGRGADDRLRANQMVAKLSAPIKFSTPQSRADKNPADVAEVEFQGQVAIDHFGRDETGPLSHEKMELERLSINQQTGAINGTGPGIIRSTRFGDAASVPGGLNFGLPNNGANAGQDAGPKLSYVRVDFDERLIGNLYLKEVSFTRRVRAVYGPVDSWEQELDGNQMDLLPPNSMVITCDELKANEDPVAARLAPKSSEKQKEMMGKAELLALGNVRINGESKGGGRFFASGLKASYSQSKLLLRLEGDSRAPAELIFTKRPGEAASSPFKGEAISYSLDSKLPRVDRFQGFEFTMPERTPPAGGSTPPATGARQPQWPSR